jgi:hypothetical protein
MIVGAILQATAFGVPHLIVARIVSGVGMVSLPLVPLQDDDTDTIFLGLHQFHRSGHDGRVRAQGHPRNLGLRSTLHSQLRHHAGLLDRLRFRHHRRRTLLCMAHPCHPSMLLPRADAHAARHPSRNTTLAPLTPP